MFDIQTVISKHYKFFYFAGNFLFSICLISNHIQILEEYGVNVLICITTLIFYFLAYYNLKVNGANLKLKSFFNQFAFSYNISFLLAWNASYLTITFATFLSCFKIDSSYVCVANLSLQFLLCVFVVLVLSYFQDLSFSFIILIFQLGNTLNQNIFQYKSYENLEQFEIKATKEIKDEYNLNLILTAFTAMCFFSSAIFYYFKSERKKDRFMDELAENYKNYGEKTYL